MEVTITSALLQASITVNGTEVSSHVGHGGEDAGAGGGGDVSLNEDGSPSDKDAGPHFSG